MTDIHVTANIVAPDEYTPVLERIDVDLNPKEKLIRGTHHYTYIRFLDQKRKPINQ